MEAEAEGPCRPCWALLRGPGGSRGAPKKCHGTGPRKPVANSTGEMSREGVMTPEKQTRCGPVSISSSHPGRSCCLPCWAPALRAIIHARVTGVPCKMQPIVQILKSLPMCAYTRMSMCVCVCFLSKPEHSWGWEGRRKGGSSSLESLLHL